MCMGKSIRTHESWVVQHANDSGKLHSFIYRVSEFVDLVVTTRIASEESELKKSTRNE